MISILFFISSAFASPPQMWVRPQFDGRRYTVEAECPGTCLPIMENDLYADEEVSDYIGGHWVLNNTKKTARVSEISAFAAKKAKKDGSDSAIKSAKNFSELQQAIMDKLGIE